MPPSLLIDLGNTNLKWASCRDRDLAPARRIQHRALDLPRALDTEWGHLAAPARVHIASVAGAATKAQIGDWVRRHWHLELVEARSSKEACGVVNAYADAGKLGVDRWLCLIAVRHQLRAPACVVDCGTAVTVDGLDGDGQHLGGLIVPGLAMMRDALLRDTQIQAASPVGPLDLMARDTENAVAAGGTYACAGLVELFVRRIAHQCGRVPAIVLTGGDGAKLQAVLEIEARYEPDLVLQGLGQLVGEMES